MSEREKNMEAIAEEQIVNDILKNLKMIDNTHNISYGSKDMDLYVLGDRDHEKTSELLRFETSIANIQGEETRKPKETRLLYKAAQKFFQGQVNEIGKHAHYYFDTGNPKLLEFARTHGKKIFDWDHEPTEEDFLAGRDHFTKLFEPDTDEN